MMSKEEEEEREGGRNRKTNHPGQVTNHEKTKKKKKKSGTICRVYISSVPPMPISLPFPSLPFLPSARLPRHVVYPVGTA